MLTNVKRGIIAALSFIVDLSSLIQDTGQQIDFSVLGASFRRGAFKVQLAEAVAIAETAIDVDPLEAPLKKGQIIDFGAAGGTMQLTADAAVGAVLINIVSPLGAFADNAVGYAQRQGFGASGYHVPAGTILARNPTTFKMFPRSLAAGGETAQAILLTDAKSDSTTDSLTGYGITYGGSVYENLLPEAVIATGLIDSTYKTELGVRFVWKISRDDRGS